MKVTKQIEVTIIMDSIEARWLKGIMQNPLLNSETSQDMRMRKMFWEILDTEGVQI